MNINPEAIAEMAAMDRPQTPQDALRNLDNVASLYNGTREDHLILRSAIRLLQRVVKEHAELTVATQEQPEGAAADSDE